MSSIASNGDQIVYVWLTELKWQQQKTVACDSILELINKYKIIYIVKKEGPLANAKLGTKGKLIVKLFLSCCQQLHACIVLLVLLLLLLLLLKKNGNARPGEGDWHPISPKTPAAHYQPIEEKKRKGK